MFSIIDEYGVFSFNKHQYLYDSDTFAGNISLFDVRKISFSFSYDGVVGIKYSFKFVIVLSPF